MGSASHTFVVGLHLGTGVLHFVAGAVLLGFGGSLLSFGLRMRRMVHDPDSGYSDQGEYEMGLIMVIVGALAVASAAGLFYMAASKRRRVEAERQRMAREAGGDPDTKVLVFL